VTIHAVEALRHSSRGEVPVSFERSAGRYDDHVAFNRAGVRRLVAALPDERYRSLLDVACGTGFASLEMIRRHGVERIVGIDASPAMLEEFRLKLRGHPEVRAELHAADVLAMPVEPGTFDAVICSMALHWFGDRPGAIAAMARAVRPGGVLGILGPGPGHDAECVALLLGVSPPLLPQLPQAILDNELYPRQVEADVTAAGLEIVDMWLETRVRRVPPERYLARMRAVGSHLWDHLPPYQQESALERVRRVLAHAAGPDGRFAYTFTKLFVIARA
jgi:ubiquinone/menaquinone biosynthesis C-methylase UbiE